MPMFHMGSVLQITSRWFNVLRSALTLNHLTDCRQAVTWTQGGHQFVEISYLQVGFSIADTYCCVMTCS
jgi:hypothetical protein